MTDFDIMHQGFSSQAQLGERRQNCDGILAGAKVGMEGLTKAREFTGKLSFSFQGLSKREDVAVTEKEEQGGFGEAGPPPYSN